MNLINPLTACYRREIASWELKMISRLRLPSLPINVTVYKQDVGMGFVTVWSLNSRSLYWRCFVYASDKLSLVIVQISTTAVNCLFLLFGNCPCHKKYMQPFITETVTSTVCGIHIGKHSEHKPYRYINTASYWILQNKEKTKFMWPLDPKSPECPLPNYWVKHPPG